MRVPNSASILKDWSQHTFISCFFHILRAKKQISSQESKSSGLGTHISNMRVPFQITSNCYTEVFDAINIFKDSTLKCIRSLDFVMLICQLHHVAFDWLKSQTPFPGPNT